MDVTGTCVRLSDTGKEGFTARTVASLGLIMITAIAWRYRESCARDKKREETLA
jgi:hypothetical protein